MAKRFAEQHAVFPHQRSNLQPKKFNHLSLPRQENNDDLCGTFPHNSPSWVAYMDEPELSCRMDLDNNGPKITFSTGKNTKIDTIQVCQNITSDPKDLKACIKRLDRGLLPGINGEKGEVTVYLDDDGNFSFREDGLFTDAREYNVVNLVDAVGSAQYTQRTPDMTTLRMKATIEDNPIVVYLSVGVVGIAVIATLANLTYLSIKSNIAKRRRSKEDLRPIPIDLKTANNQPNNVKDYEKKRVASEKSLSTLSKLRSNLISIGKYHTNHTPPMRSKVTDPQSQKGLEEKKNLSNLAADAARELSQFDAYKD